MNEVLKRMMEFYNSIADPLGMPHYQINNPLDRFPKGSDTPDNMKKPTLVPGTKDQNAYEPKMDHMDDGFEFVPKKLQDSTKDKLPPEKRKIWM